MNFRIATLFAAALCVVAALAWYGGRHFGSPVHGAAMAPAVTAADTAPVRTPGTGKILYYRNPMGLPDISPVPKHDSMGMDYVPVREGDEAAAGHFRIDPTRLQRLGVRTVQAAHRSLAQRLQLAGTLQVDERRESTVNAKFEGWVTALHVATTGERVHRGEPLLAVYSPELLAAQQDYRVAVQALAALQAGDAEARRGAERLVQAGVERLRNAGIAEEELAALRAGGAPKRELLLRAPADGIVIDKPARVGMRFAPGDALYQLADLDSLWLIASVYEQDLALVRVGQAATASFAAMPGEHYTGTVEFISPVLQAETRTAQLRLRFANRGGQLKPGMFADVEVLVPARKPLLAVPDSAVLDTGTRQLVLVDHGGGVFEPRAVQVGLHADGYTEVREGLAEGEAVVVSANFLIDAESQLRSVVGPMSPAPQPAPPKAGH
jgi:membrane fusion protein, copper/silver efflux system